MLLRGSQVTILESKSLTMVIREKSNPSIIAQYSSLLLNFEMKLFFSQFLF